ncbi:hypothetical protein ES288_A02G017300v1 [Gossypium darwinii]|uniref:Uncharacterized protein n=2 Tax=Gossypium TaxID=3633 RepID=A0A5D2RFB3_GOSTO|nr:hypothetical protein ES288_A02G017300v1 [Gossypium darwinii]TYI38304.1 hypothetical protein ES332_A02G017100v1 [Gossypium tomentosum]
MLHCRPMLNSNPNSFFSNFLPTEGNSDMPVLAYISKSSISPSVTRMMIKAELMSPMSPIKVLKEASILMRKLVLTTSIEEIPLEAQK